MPKQIYKILLTIIIIVISVYIIGTRKGPKINADLEIQLPFARDYVYSIYSDIRSYPNVKKNLKNIEILEKNSNNILRWVENYNNGTRLEYRIIGKKENIYFDYEVYNIKTRDTSKITMNFNEEKDFTIISMNETGQIEDKFKRGLRFLIGDRYSLTRESKWLRVAIMKEQLDRK